MRHHGTRLRLVGRVERCLRDRRDRYDGHHDVVVHAARKDEMELAAVAVPLVHGILSYHRPRLCGFQRSQDRIRWLGASRDFRRTLYADDDLALWQAYHTCS